MYDAQFPKGTPVCIRQSVRRRQGRAAPGDDFTCEVVGVVESWEKQPTGSWHAHGQTPVGAEGPKLWLDRLMLRKLDGELTLIVIDDATEIAKLEA